MQIANIFRSNIVDISPATLTIEITGNRNKVDACIGMLRPFGLKRSSQDGNDCHAQRISRQRLIKYPPFFFVTPKTPKNLNS